MKNFDAINKQLSAFLTNIYEPRDNFLLLEVKNAQTSEVEVDVEIGGKILSGCRPVTIDESGIYFTISFNDYVSYHVLNESYALFNPKDEYVAGDFGIFRVFLKSGYMDFILNETFANDMYPDELIHYGLFTENHVVHVISRHEPIIDIHQSINQDG